ncbi:RNA-directed DNA polymerase (reverse transcriptase)-related family protein [Rhynchospora pubera]|uniref:RNA-directed DNA polymerase (Reverse transcriptase)-related family protein n=1 Tax=Rhynchospora pubera TaxID=906938 RepID=A0AAV8CSK0_9POAL|nr:RNA-directed DNA polymerase (reverse transcriptase)-related family protein [Rhynchospora pubera]
MQHPTVRNHALEEKLLAEYDLAEEQHYQYWQQRSRLQWVEKGDRNTSFFHTVATNRRRNNLITMIKQEDGQMTGDEKKIYQAFVTYFAKMYRPVEQPNQDLNGERDSQNVLIREFFTELGDNTGAHIPNSAHNFLASLPDYAEIKRVLFSMGSDKAAGPDGITCRFLQKYWMVIGNDLVEQIRRIFHTEDVPSEWLKCNVVLIPKNNEPESPSDYRPLSIGNVLYRLTMKIIAERLRPYMRKIISHEQTAFVKGKCISDNIILVREILHSFRQQNFKQKAFLLKADITKAFDKLNWQFLQQAMQYLNMPGKITRILKNSYECAKVTIRVNGVGDGFIVPTQGVRQGCPMSPYVFIMAMEILTRVMTKAMAHGQIKGVKVAENGPRISHVIYADDLVLMGDTNEQELREFVHIMVSFGNVSGLVINPVKSKIWISKQCDDSAKARVQALLQAEAAVENEIYLGAYLKHPNSASLTGKMLLEKMGARLAGWKSSMLSHAGRLVLIKSVLASLPVYYMTTEQIPKKWLKEMTGLIARFFWGKVGKSRYMTFIAWDKVCTPLEKGGLGVRNLNTVGEALFLKLVWALLSDEDKLWVQLCKAKYFHKEDSWGAGLGSKSSTLWRNIAKRRQFFINDVTWQIRDGKKINAISQPWFPGWEIANNMARENGQLKVADLYDQQMRVWRVGQLNYLFGQGNASTIQAQNTIPMPVALLPDRLIWLKAKNGKYTAKQGYLELQKDMQNAQLTQTNLQWVHMWNWKGIVPKVKVFIWRLLSRTLPVAQNIHRRINAFSPMCYRCGTENEFETHCMFFCPSSRVVWFGGTLGIATHALPMNIEDAFRNITEGIDEEGRRYICYTLWEIWLARNQEIFHHRKIDPIAVWRKVNDHVNAHRMINDMEPYIGLNVRQNMDHKIPIHEWMVLMDASCDKNGQAGMAFLIYKMGVLVGIGANHQSGLDPFWGEATVLMEVLQHIQRYMVGGTVPSVTLLTDCLNLVNAINEQDVENIPSWKATDTVAKAIVIINNLAGELQLRHVKRDIVKPAHILANHARRDRFFYLGPPCPHIVNFIPGATVLDGMFFVQLQDRPP